MEVQIISLLMSQNSNSIRNWRSFTFQLVLARLGIVLKSLNVILLIASLSKFVFSWFKHYQRDIVRGVEGYIVTGSKQVEIGELLKIFFRFLDMVSFLFFIIYTNDLILFFLYNRYQVVRRQQEIWH